MTATLPPDHLDQRHRGTPPDPAVAWCTWVLRLRADDRLVGTVQAAVTEAGSVAEIARVIGAPWQGQGLATEAAKGPVSWLTRTPAVRKVVAHIHPAHRASAAVAAAASLTPAGEWHDGEVRWRRATRS
ncbi:GNAT family N-acetyltransferase [Streptomyces sp. SAS_276]|uniref:GNAT family N-acetyltransferase n=1 Tax=Streptomyces sp. SAS_276 TaxID=3412745 RepID=UPI00403CDCD2